MGILSEALGEIIARTLSNLSTDLQGDHSYKSQNNYKSKKKYRNYQQNRSPKEWHGVPLYELGRIARTTSRGKYVTIGEHNCLLIHFTSRSGKTKYAVPCDLDRNGRLMRLTNRYLGYRDDADTFIERVNQEITFS